MKVLITGAAGFLGLHIARYFASKKATLYLLDVAPFAKHEYPKNATFIYGDVRDRNLANKITKEVDVVIHAAAALPLAKADQILDVNINGTDNYLYHSQKNGVQRFIYISSTAVYGVPKVHPLYEYFPMHGVGPYGISKIEAERRCAYYRERGLTVTIIRPKTFVGTYRLGVFEILFDWIKSGKKIPVIGSGLNYYQLLDVDDLVEALYMVSVEKNIKKINDTFNIGTEKYRTVQEDLQELFDYAHSGSRIFPTPAGPIKAALFVFEKLHLSPLYEWVYATADKDSFVSVDKLKKATGWKARYSNSQALIKAYQWYEDNYDEIKSRGSGTSHTVGWKQGILGFFKRFM
jgi:nucleoside-diphosphate-sugar epimerase